MGEEKTIIYGNSENENIKFYTKNVSIVGCNGSGKSSLMRKIKSLNSNFTIVSAHKNLTIRQGLFRANDDNWLVQHKSLFQNPTSGEQSQPNDNNYVQNDFNQIIEIVFREYNDQSVEALNAGKRLDEINRSLDKIFNVWNSIFIDKKLLYKDKKVKVQVVGEETFYDIENLSDGERCALYVLIKVLLAEPKSTIIIDEPETFLNPSILNNLFDECEKMKSDCSFLYLSHDLEFVTTRKNNTIFWIKNYKYPNTWNIINIDPQEIPEELIVKVIGAKKQKILFVESKNNKDSQLYQLIYPDFKVWPVGGCDDVINYTKAFNSRTEKFNKEYRGLIDRDLRPDEQIESLKNDKVYSIPYAIYENLFLDKNIIKFIFDCLGNPDYTTKIIELETEVKQKLSDESFKLAFKKSKVKRLFDTNIDSIAKGEMSITANSAVYDSEINSFNSKTYEEVLKIYNQKCLKGCVSKLGNYNWTDWQSIVLNIFNTDRANDLRAEFLKIMPNIV